MIKRATSYRYMILAIGVTLLLGATGKVKADCDIEDVCKRVEIIKQDIFAGSPTPSPTESIESIQKTLDSDTIKIIKKDCQSMSPESSNCALEDVIKKCWDKGTADVVNHCKPIDP